MNYDYCTFIIICNTEPEVYSNAVLTINVKADWLEQNQDEKLTVATNRLHSASKHNVLYLVSIPI